MAKNFEKAASSKKFSEIARANSEKANLVTVKMLKNERLFDYPENFEDTADTTDIENSIRELGFTDPLEVTPFGMSEGDYMIVSGHRRRAAGVKAGLDVFPCIVKYFDSKNDVKNYALLSNSQRDSSKDPLLICRRYKMHEEYLKSVGFEGSFRDEIARRLGISPQQADRYNQFNRIISPVWDMVRDELVGMSSVLPMAVHDAGQQHEILKILYECVDNGVSLTRETCDIIIKSYRAGKRQFFEIFRQKKDVKRQQLVHKHIEGLMRCLGRDCVVESAEEAEKVFTSFREAFGDIIKVMYTIGKSYDKTELFQEFLETVNENVRQYKEK